MALWTPANSTVQPKLMMKATDAVWSGSSLSSIINSGSEGGSFTLAGTPDKGTALNGTIPIRFDDNGEALQKVFDFPNSGEISFFTFSKLISGGVRGYFNRNWWVGEPMQLTFYANASGFTGGTVFFGNRDGGTYASSAPSWQGTYQFQTDGEIASIYGQGGATNDAWVDGVQDALTGSLDGFPLAGAAPDYPSATWELGRGQTHGGGGEVSNAEFLCIAIFSQYLPTDERQKWEGFFHHQAGTQSSLPALHPYFTNAPTTGGGAGRPIFRKPLRIFRRR